MSANEATVRRARKLVEHFNQIESLERLEQDADEWDMLPAEVHTMWSVARRTTLVD